MKNDEEDVEVNYITEKDNNAHIIRSTDQPYKERQR